jgi:hypothetical protein
MANLINVNNPNNNQIEEVVHFQNARRCANIITAGVAGLCLFAFGCGRLSQNQPALTSSLQNLLDKTESCRAKIGQVIDEKCKENPPHGQRIGLYSPWAPNLDVEFDDGGKYVSVVVDTSFCEAIGTEHEASALQSLRNAFDVALAEIKSVGKQIQNIGTNFQNEVQLLRDRMDGAQFQAG